MAGKAVDRHAIVAGRSSDCHHRLTADVYSEGGDLLGGDCRSCRKRFGWAVCDGGCSTEKKRLWVAIESKGMVARFCTEDCHRHWQDRAVKHKPRTVGGKGRK